MHIAKINAEVMLPKVCIDANSSEEISIANNVGTITFNLFNKTPLKINSSEMGEINTVVRKLPTTSELLNEKWMLIKDSIDGKAFRIRLDKYRNP